MRCGKWSGRVTSALARPRCLGSGFRPAVDGLPDKGRATVAARMSRLRIMLTFPIWRKAQRTREPRRAACPLDTMRGFIRLLVFLHDLDLGALLLGHPGRPCRREFYPCGH